MITVSNMLYKPWVTLENQLFQLQARSLQGNPKRQATP